MLKFRVGVVFLQIIFAFSWSVWSEAKGDESLNIGLKYVVYKNREDDPVLSVRQVNRNVRAINEIWIQCGIQFQVDKYVAVSPVDYGLEYHPAETSEMMRIRKAFAENTTFLVVTTGTWDRSGSLGDTGANAWTTMPQEGPFGSVIEKPEGTFINLIAHELGHYLNLDHENDEDNLMSPILYGASNDLDASQCRIARSAINTYWQGMKR